MAAVAQAVRPAVSLPVSVSIRVPAKMVSSVVMEVAFLVRSKLTSSRARTASGMGVPPFWVV